VAKKKRNRAAYKKSIGDWLVPSMWLTKYRNLKRRPMQFYSKKDPHSHRPWQIAPVDDMSRTVVITKGRQMGFTEIFISNMIYMATLGRCRTIYTMPKWDKAQEIARTRISPVGKPGHPDAFIDPVLGLLDGWGSVMNKQITPLNGGGESDILITGSWNEDLGESTAADRVFLDEFDRMKPGVIAAFRECLSSSKMKHLRIFSTPTFPKVGVDGQYVNSDQHRWMYKCNKCGHWQFLTSSNIQQVKGSSTLLQRLEAHDETASVPDGAFIIACLKCGKELDRWGAKNEWVSHNAKGEIRGYKASQLDCVWITADDIMRKLREYKPIGKWYNYVLAEGYMGDSAQLAENFVYQLVHPEIMISSRSDFDRQFKATNVVVGIDWGKSNWAFVLGITPEHQNPILLEPFMFLDTTDPEDTVNAMVELAQRWKADCVVADYGYGQDRNPKLYQRAPCQTWICKYPPAGTAGATSEVLFGPQNPSNNAAYPSCAIGRAPSIKERLNELYNKQLTIPKLQHLEKHLDVIDMHFRNVAITVEELRDGSMVEVAESTGPDHFLHAFNYAMIGLRWLRVHNVSVREIDPPGSIRSDTDPHSSLGLPTFDDVVDAMDLFDF